MQIVNKGDLERFWSHVNKNGALMPKVTSECYEWTGAFSKKGFAIFSLNSEWAFAQRCSYATFVGPVSDDMKVARRYHNVKCIRPEHLYLRPKGVRKKDPRSMEERFWEMVDKNGPQTIYVPTPCFNWLGATSSGYGTLHIDGEQIGAHRISWIIHKGPILDDLCVLHHCENKFCTRIEHLFIGTKGDNNRDKVAKGLDNAPFGAASPKAKLTDEIISEYEPGISMESIGIKYGVEKSTIRAITNRKSWKHLPIPKKSFTDKETALRGEKSPVSILTELEVKEIRRIYSECNVSCQDLADQYNVHRETIRAICVRKTWAHIQ